MYCSADMGAWQLIEERADDDYDTAAGIDRVMQEYWGLRHIDDPVLRRVTATDAPTERYYHLTDVQFSTVAMIGMAGRDPAPVVERVGYDAYGKASHRWPGDFDDDGNVNSSDAAIMAAASSPNTPMTSSGYDVRLDLNRDGQIDTNDDAIFSAMGSIAAINAGDISDHSSTGPDNVFGYDGYVFAPELLRYCVRFRWYDPVMGRWMERDPAGYVDGTTLLQYCASQPTSRIDTLGLASIDSPSTTPSCCPEQDCSDAVLSAVGGAVADLLTEATMPPTDPPGPKLGDGKGPSCEYWQKLAEARNSEIDRTLSRIEEFLNGLGCHVFNATAPGARFPLALLARQKFDEAVAKALSPKPTGGCEPDFLIFDIALFFGSGGTSAPAKRVAAECLEAQLGRLATSAATSIPGRGAVRGTLVHSLFTRLGRQLGLDSVEFEVAYLNGARVASNTKGCVRFDVVVYDSRGAIKAIYDLTRGGASLTSKRIAQLRSHLPKPCSSVPIKEIHAP